VNPIFKGLIGAGIGVVILAALVLVGGAIVDQYGYTLRTETTTNGSTSNTLTPLINTSVDVGTTGLYPYLQELTLCANSSAGNALPTSAYTIAEGDDDGGTMYLSNVSWNNTAVNCSNIVYLADSTGSDTASLFITGLNIFGAFIGIIVLSLIGFAVIRIFKQN